MDLSFHRRNQVGISLSRRAESLLYIKQGDVLFNFKDYFLSRTLSFQLKFKHIVTLHIIVMNLIEKPNILLYPKKDY